MLILIYSFGKEKVTPILHKFEKKIVNNFQPLALQQNTKTTKLPKRPKRHYWKVFEGKRKLGSPFGLFHAIYLTVPKGKTEKQCGGFGERLVARHTHFGTQQKFPGSGFV